MTSAAMDVVGYLPAPAGRENCAAADLLEGQLFAYGVNSGIAIVEVQRLQIACVLQGAHRNAAVTAIRWSPECHARHLTSGGHLRLASGDSDGGVVVWDVTGAAVLHHLDEVSNARGAPRRGTEAAVQGLAWVLPRPDVLAVIFAPAQLLLWDVKAGTVLWRRELSSSETITSLSADPLDRRRLCLCGSQGALVVLTMNGPDGEALEQKQYRVNVLQEKQQQDSAPGGKGSSSSSSSNKPGKEGGGGSGVAVAQDARGAPATLQAVFGVTRDLLFVMLPRELLVFDLELGECVATKALSKDKSAFAHLLGVFGEGVSQGLGDEGGIDFIHAAHQDGSLSVWVRTPGELRYSLASLTRLTPAVQRGVHASSPALVAVCAQLWKDDSLGDEPQHRQSVAGTLSITRQLTASLTQRVTTGEDGKVRASPTKGNTASAAARARATISGRSLLVMAVTSDGRIWQWDAPLPVFPERSFLTSTEETPITSISGTIQQAQSRAAPETVLPQLVGLLHSLPASTTTFSLYPRPVLAPKQALRGAGAAADPAFTAWDFHSAANAAAGGSHGADPFANFAGVTGAGAAVQQGAAFHGTEDAAEAIHASNSSSSSNSSELVMLGAVATASGSIDVVVVRRGVINPFGMEVACSLAVHKDAVRGVRWLGSTPRFVSFSVEKAVHGGYRNCLVMTDIRSRRSIPFRDTTASDAGPVSGLRASPSGAYLLLLFKGCPAELWGIPADSPTHKPFRVRLVDLPFTAVEWVLPESVVAPVVAPALSARRATGDGVDGAGGEMAAAWVRSPRAGDGSNGQHGREAQQRSSTDHQAARLTTAAGGQASSSGGAAPASTSSTMPGDALPEEMLGLAFSLADGRSGILGVKGKKMVDTRPKRPVTAAGAQVDLVGTAIAALGHTVFMGDSEGNLMHWDTNSGRANVMPTGYGAVRRIQLAPPASLHLYTSPDAVPEARIRLAVLFSSGAFGVYEVDTAGKLRRGHASPMACASAGRLLDLAWLPLPRSIGGGTILAAATEDGSFALLDAAQAADRRPSFSARQRMMKQLLATPTAFAATEESAGVTACLAPPRPLGSSLLMPRPWVLLLRLVVQLGLSHVGILCLSSPTNTEDDEVRDELARLLPRSARAQLAQLAQGEGAGGPAAALADELDALRPPTSSCQPSRPGDQSASANPSTAASPEPILPTSTSTGSLSRTTTGLSSSVSRGASPQPHQHHAGSAFRGDLVALLRHIAALRADGQALRPEEWKSYAKALTGGLVAERMAVAARTSGDLQEARFWSHLPATLAGVRTTYNFIQQHNSMQQARQSSGQQQGQQDHQGAPSSSAAASSLQPSSTAADDTGTLGGDDGVAGTAGEPDAASEASPDGNRELVAALDADGQGFDHVFQQQQQQQHAAGASGAASSSRSGTPRMAGNAAGAQGLPGGRKASVPGHLRYAGPGHFSSASAIKQVAAGRAVRLWDEGLALADAQERTLWHEGMSRALFDSEALQERRLLEYVVLGDFQTAVAFLLASPPERTARYYRSSVITLALAATASLRAQGIGSRPSASATLHLQAAKVLSAHGASVGDVLLGVPLNCSAGLNAEATHILQEAGLWRYAANLTAHALRGTERAQALSRWAVHVLQSEGSVWRAVGILTAAGCLRAALGALRDAKLPDCCQAYVMACRQAGLVLPSPPTDGAHSTATAADGVAAGVSSGMRRQSGGLADSGNLGEDMAGVDAFGERSQKAEELFDMLGQRWRGARDRAARQPIAASDEIGVVTVEFERFIGDLISQL